LVTIQPKYPYRFFELCLIQREFTQTKRFNDHRLTGFVGKGGTKMNIGQSGRIATAGLVMALSFGIANAFVAGPAPGKGAHFAVLLGGNEISDSGAANAGDTNGRGSATVLIHGNGKLCYGITVTGIDTPTAAHIHRGLAGLEGPVVVTLTAPSAGNPGASSKCLSGLSQDLLNEIQAEPGEFYVNIHSGNFSGGALRGNLF
jgi:hypothetical protein